MRIHYDPKSDMMGISLSSRRAKVSAEVDRDVVLDYDENGLVVGIEIFHASEHADLAEITVAISQWARPDERNPVPAKLTQQ